MIQREGKNPARNLNSPAPGGCILQRKILLFEIHTAPAFAGFSGNCIAVT